MVEEARIPPLEMQAHHRAILRTSREGDGAQLRVAGRRHNGREGDRALHTQEYVHPGSGRRCSPPFSPCPTNAFQEAYEHSSGRSRAYAAVVAGWTPVPGGEDGEG